MKYFYLFLFVSWALFVPSAGFAQSTETLETAEYKPPQVGTRIVYSNWACTVEEVDGFSTKCKLDDGQTVVLFAWLEIDGSFPRAPYFANRYKSPPNFGGGGGGPQIASRISKKAQSLLTSLWPLEIGREVRYSTKVQVEEPSEHTRRFWFAPELGLVIKEEFTFEKGPFRSRRYESTLVSAHLPDGTSLLDSPSATPPPVIASEPKPPAVIASVPEAPPTPVVQSLTPEVG